MANLRIGSAGEEVEKLQMKLGFTGEDVDGVFGQKTEKAVKAYQAENDLVVDGIAGEKTLGKLYGTVTTNSNTGGNTNTGSGNDSKTPATVTSPGGFTYGDFQYEDFKPSDAVQQANALLQQQQANKPGAWTDPHQDKWMGYLSQIENRDPFSYNVNADALYQQYKDQYIQQGQLAMMDTMGQAAAMTGGYGNSYAQGVGQQAYNQYLGQLNNVVPELYGMAYDRYQQEGQDLYSKYSLYKDLSDQSYTQYQNSVDDWYREMSRLTDDYNTKYSREYEDYLLGRNTAYDEYSTDRSEAFSKWQMEGSSTPTKYADLDYDVWEKRFRDAKSPAEVEILEKRMIQSGIDPQTAADWKEDYVGKLEENGYEGNMGTKRKIEIEDWLISIFKNKNLSPSFDPMKLIQSSGFLTSKEEREYAKAILAELK